MKQKKYIAWDEETGKLIYPRSTEGEMDIWEIFPDGSYRLKDTDGKYLIVGSKHRADTGNNLFEFTGGYDKHKLEIYEGHILRYFKPNASNIPEELFEVRFSDSEFKFGYFNLRCGWFDKDCGNKLMSIGHNKRGAWCEIVGHKCTNPEMLDRNYKWSAN